MKKYGNFNLFQNIYFLHASKTHIYEIAEKNPQ
jgi:hypothetical protein